MRRALRLLALTGIAALLAAAGPAVAAPPNPAFCYQLFNEYNKCNRQQQRRGGGWGGGHEGGWGGGGWGGGQQWRGYGGYGDHGGYHGGGWDGHDDDGPYGPPRWRGRPRQQADCSRWLVAMSLNRCTE